MTAFVDNSSLDVSERNLIAITLNIHTKSHTVRGRPILKLLERFGNGRSANFTRDQFTSDPLGVNLLSKNIKWNHIPAHVNTTVYLDVIEKPVEYQKLLWNISEEGKETKGICLWAYSSKLTEVLLAWLRHYVKVRRITKNVCKLHIKRVRLNKIEKKYLLNCCVRLYLYKRQTHVSNYCKFQLSSDIEKKPWSYSSVHCPMAKQ